MSNPNKITILIISYKSLEKLENCIRNIGFNKNIIIIENSNKIEIKNIIEKKYPNSKVILNHQNLGYATAANLGFSKAKEKYVLLLNPDIIIHENQINEMEKEISILNDEFTLASPISDDLKDFNKNNKIDNIFTNHLDLNPKKNISKADLVKGCSLLVNLSKFKNTKIFDEKFFFFFEEMDLCRRIKDKNENIVIFNNIKIDHLSAESVDKNINEDYHCFRHWNYFWGRFYYFKKHYGFFYSLLLHFGKLARFSLNSLRFFFISKEKYKKNKFRFLGLINSIIGRKSVVSRKILEKNISNSDSNV